MRQDWTYGRLWSYSFKAGFAYITTDLLLGVIAKWVKHVIS